MIACVKVVWQCVLRWVAVCGKVGGSVCYGGWHCVVR